MKTKKDVAELLQEVLSGLEFQEAYERVSSEVNYLREQGQKEYAHDDQNALANFDRLAEKVETDPKKVLWIYFTKHYDGTQAYINGHRSQRENVRGRINDQIVYLILLRAMIDREEGK